MQLQITYCSVRGNIEAADNSDLWIELKVTLSINSLRVSAMGFTWHVSPSVPTIMHMYVGTKLLTSSCWKNICQQCFEIYNSTLDGKLDVQWTLLSNK